MSTALKMVLRDSSLAPKEPAVIVTASSWLISSLMEARITMAWPSQLNLLLKLFVAYKLHYKNLFAFFSGGELKFPVNITGSTVIGIQQENVGPWYRLTLLVLYPDR
jgi:hypothetical protein